MQQFNQAIIIRGVYIDDNKLVIITEPKTIHFDSNVETNNNLKHKINHIIKCNELFNRKKQQQRLDDYCSNIIMETIFMNTEKR